MKRIGYFVSLVVVLSVLVVGAPLPALAQSPCDDMVVDGANVFGSGITQVQAAAQSLARQGADVRVRTIDTYGSAGNLDNYERSLEQQCRSWQSPDGGRKNNLIVLIISVSERQTGLYYGSEWNASLGPNWTRIQTDAMNPRFRDGDFTGGFVAGLKEIEGLVAAQVHPQATNPPATPAPGTSQPEPAQPARDLSGLLWVLAGLGGIFVVGIIVIITSATIKGRRSDQQKRQAARQEARQAKAGTSALLLNLDSELQDLEIGVELVASQLAGESTAAKLRGDLANAQTLTNQASSAYQDLDSSADPDRAKLVSVDEYQRAEAGYRNVLSLAQQAEAATAQLKQQVDQLQALISETPKTIEAAGAAIEQAKVDVAEATAKGFKIGDAESALQSAANAVEQANAEFQQKRFMGAHQAAQSALQSATGQSESAKGLPVLKLQLDDAARKLEDRISEVRNKIEEGRSTFGAISAKYAESSWSPIRGNGTESENRIMWASKALDLTRECSSMENQQWQKAQEALAQANAWLDEADSFLHSIAALKENLETAERDAASEVADTESDIAQALQFCRQYTKDVRGGLVDDLNAAEQLISAAKEELGKERPDYLLVVKQAKQAHAAADKALSEARSEHEAAERLRAKAKSEIRDAHTAVSRAKEFIQDHNRDVGADAKTLLASAQERLQRLASETDLNAQITLADEAEKLADEAYAKAEEDFKAADRARVPNTNWIWIAAALAASRGSHHGGGWGSGGSGGGGFGGGGSSGWGGGGGGGGGGGSTGW